MRCTLHHVEDVAKAIKTFWFVPEHPVAFIPGQYAQWHLPHDAPDSRGDHRWFTISAAPTEPYVAFTTKFAENGSSFKRHLASLAPGATIDMSPPVGGFVLPADTTQPLILVAGGIGVTPFRSMVQWLRDTNTQRPIHLVYAVTHEVQLAFTDLFTAYGLTFTPVVLQPSVEWAGETGSLSADRLLAITKYNTFANPRIYLSGPEPMVQVLQKDLQGQGIDDTAIMTDFFPGYTEDL